MTSALSDPRHVTGLVFDVKRFAIHDGPGIRTTVFLKGCPLRCRWCHNPEGKALYPELLWRPERCIGCGQCVTACPHQAILILDQTVAFERSRCRNCGACVERCYAEARVMAGQWRSVADVCAEALRDGAFYRTSGGGVTISGGEPLAQAEFAIALLTELRRAGVHTALDTSGMCPPDTLMRAAQLTDLVLFDLKHLDSQAHLEGTGFPPDQIVANLKMLAAAGVNIVVRTPVIEGFNADIEFARQLGRFLSRHAPGAPVELLPYHRLGSGKARALGLTPDEEHFGVPERSALDGMAAAICAVGVPCTVVM